MKKLLFVAACLPLVAIADDNADCGVGAEVINPISLVQSQVADFGMIPSSEQWRWVALDVDGTVWQVPSWTKDPLNDQRFIKEIGAVGAAAGQFTYSGTEGYPAKISKGAIASCDQGTFGDMAIVVRDKIAGEYRVRDGWFKSHWEYDGADGDFNVGVIMGIVPDFVGHIQCDYQLSAEYY